jgi:glyoxylase-like metal-dependent hydrolase (beta-lactamase superfamily II)
VQLIFEQIRAGGDRNFGYLLADRDSRAGVLIDPSYSPEAFVQRAVDQGITITHIINTHGHPDHVNGNSRAVELTGARVAAHPLSPARPTTELLDGQQLAIGALHLQILHVPGHADDHLVVYEPSYGILVTGDLLFVGKVGGTPTEQEARTEWQSLQRILATIPDACTVWPGHDYGVRPSSSIGLERRTNPFLLCPDEAAFLRLKNDWPEFKKKYGLK